MSKGVIEALDVVGAYIAAAYGAYGLAASLLASAFSTDQARRAEMRAKEAYNASLHDRYVTTRSTQAARQLVFGRCRVSGPAFFATSYGSTRQHLVMCIALAAHEIDAIETVYFDEQPVVIDAFGNVTGTRAHDSFSITTSSATFTIKDKPLAGSVTATVRYGAAVTSLSVSVSGVSVTVSGATAGVTGQVDIYYQPDPDPYAPTSTSYQSETFAITSSGQTFTLLHTPNTGSVHAALQASSAGANDGTPVTVATVSGNSVTISGGTVGRNIVIYYQVSTGTTKARVRKYLGAATQPADSALITELPGVWTSAHTATGVAYLVVELDYDQDAFIGGVPNVSATIRGMKCYDPRTGTTAWTENPALHARALLTHPLGGNLPTTQIDDAAVIAAANICDTTTSYVVGAQTYSVPLYTAGYAYQCDRRPIDGLTDLCQAMGGDYDFADGMMRVLAGSYRTPVMTLDETWLSDQDSVQISVGVPRQSLVNTVTSSIADQYQDYVVVPMPRLSPSAYTTADGTTLAQDIQYQAVTFAGQAQYIASCMMRRMRQGLTVKMRCNLRAWPAQRFDNISVTLDRFGWAAKPFEVVEDTWTEDGSIELVLRETDPSIWNMDAGFSASDPAPNTDMPRPWGLPMVTNLAALSDNTTVLVQADGTVVPRLKITWDAITDERVTVGGYVELRIWRMGETSQSYMTAKALGTDTQIYVPGVNAGAGYIVAARTGSVVTQGDWCQQISSLASGKTSNASDVTGIATSQGGGRVHLAWDACTDVDYRLTEVRIGTSWGVGTLIGKVAGTSLDWTTATPGTYTLWFSHQNASGFYSATPASTSITITSGSLGQASPPLLSLSLTSLTFTFDGTGALSPSSQTISATANLQNLTGTAAFTCTLYDSPGTSLGTITMGGTGNTRTLTGAQFTSLGAAAWADISASLGGESDSQSVVKISNGADSFVGELSNDSQTLSADNAGHVTSYTGATSTLVIYRGITDDSSNWTFSKADSTGITSSLSSNTVTVSAMSDSTPTGYVDITATRSGFPSVTKRFSLSKSLAAGAVTRVNSNIGNQYITGAATPNTATAYAGFEFNTDGYVYTRTGGSSSTWTSTGTLWYLDGAPPVGFKVRFVLVSQSGAASVTGTGGTLLTLDSTTSRAIKATITNGLSTANVSYTIYDSTGTTQLSAGTVTLDVQSTN